MENYIHYIVFCIKSQNDSIGHISITWQYFLIYSRYRKNASIVLNVLNTLLNLSAISKRSEYKILEADEGSGVGIA